MDERLLEILQKRDTKRNTTFERIEHLAKYMRRKGFTKDYESNVVKIVTYYSYVKKIDDKDYHKVYIEPFIDYIKKEYDENMAKLYFDGKLNEEEFLQKFLSSRKKQKENLVHLNKYRIVLKTNDTLKQENKKATKVKNRGNLIVNVGNFFRSIYKKYHRATTEELIKNWWEECNENLENERKNAEMKTAKEESKVKEKATINHKKI